MMMLREKITSVPTYTFCWCVCVLSDCDLREVRVFKSCSCCDIQSLWCGKWIIVGLEEANPGKNASPTGGSQITDTYQLSDIWLIGSCGCNIVDTGTFSAPDGYHSQMLSLVFSLCSSRGCILWIQIILFVLFLRFIVMRANFCPSTDLVMHGRRRNINLTLLFTLAYINSQE